MTDIGIVFSKALIVLSVVLAALNIYEFFRPERDE